MDIEKLKAIIRLANNNPSENEANLAARKACKVLAENDFALLKGHIRTAADKLGSSHTGSGVWGSSSNPSPSGWSPFEELFREARKQAANSSYNPYDIRNKEYWKEKEKSPIFDPIYDAQREAWSYDGGKTWKSNKSKYAWNGEEPKKKQTAKRKCTRCTLEVETFRIKEEPFVCEVCHWRDKV